MIIEIDLKKTFHEDTKPKILKMLTIMAALAVVQYQKPVACPCTMARIKSIEHLWDLLECKIRQRNVCDNNGMEQYFA